MLEKVNYTSLKSISQSNSPPTQKSDPVLYSTNNINEDSPRTLPQNQQISDIKLENVDQDNESDFEAFVHKGILLITKIN